MAPPRGPREPSIDRKPEYEAFMEDLAAYHEKRGTTLDREPRVGSRRVDLLKLYNAVVARGGYDSVSVEKLAWRKLGQEFSLGTTNLPALAFNLKSTYYKNLADSAYEITNIHKREPPPKEILEDVTARGADLLNRTLENYKIPGSRESGNLANGQDSDISGDEVTRTPKEEKMDIDDPGSGGGRVTRGLRQAPPQRVLFQPDVSSSRQTRHSSGNMNSPQPTAATPSASYSSSSNPNSMSFTIANYEPRPQMPLTLRPVITPSNNPELFKKKQEILKETAATKAGRTVPTYKGMMLPGTGFDGPNIYVRTLLALRSSIPEEQDYALHHLVKISHERGDKYKFDAFPGLAEGLIDRVLEVSSLFYDVKWEVSFKDDGSMHETRTLDGMNGTSDILRRLGALTERETRDDMETEEFSRKLNQVNEAGLVIRNMVMLEENASYLSRLSPIRDFICIALNLPTQPAVVELKHYALDIAEQLTKYWALETEDPLYQSLLAQLDGMDRGAILTALRAISRISMNLNENNHLKGISLASVQHICEWTLLDDEELVHACLDFLYQFTAVVENVEIILQMPSIGSLINQLVRLLLHGAKEEERRSMIKRAVKEPAATNIPNIPRDLLDQLLKYEEPERSAHWLRACFEEDLTSDITQIALWQAYQSRFATYTTPQKLLLPAAEFIKNVSTTFSGANAQVLNGPVQKFIIKGIRPRHAPMDPKGRTYQRCLWQTPSPPSSTSATPGAEKEKECGEFVLKPKQMWEHILTTHLLIPKSPDGSYYDLTPSTTSLVHTYTCHWSTCQHFSLASSNSTPTPYEAGMHIKTHLPDTSKKFSLKAKHNRSTGPGVHRDPEYQSQIWLNTQVDERGDAAGLPLTSALVLRNVARNLPKVSISSSSTGSRVETGLGVDGMVDGETEGEGKGEAGGNGWMRTLFAPVRGRLWFVMAHNRPLAGYMADLTGVIAAGGG
ncbi:MAG: Chromatin structure-remodeling complex protein rsc9 [Pycnora praestabilis]|nr:MAG: Chromatin structure-remodeling complex protein rsc9 [Pycnora praestabilis]